MIVRIRDRPHPSGQIGHCLTDISQIDYHVSALSTHTGAGLAALVTIVVGAGYFPGFYRRAFLGPVRYAVISEAVDLRNRELALVVVLAGLILLLGL